MINTKMSPIISLETKAELLQVGIFSSSIYLHEQFS